MPYHEHYLQVSISVNSSFLHPYKFTIGYNWIFPYCMKCFCFSAWYEWAAYRAAIMDSTGKSYIENPTISGPVQEHSRII